MTSEEFASLNVGDIVSGKASQQSYVVTANYGGRVTAVISTDLTNPSEWDLVSKVNHRSPPNNDAENVVKKARIAAKRGSMADAAKAMVEADKFDEESGWL